MNARMESPAPRARSGRHACGAPHRARWGRVSRTVSRIDWTLTLCAVSMAAGVTAMVLTAYSLVIVAAIAGISALWLLFLGENAPDELAGYRYPGGDQ